MGVRDSEQINIREMPVRHEREIETLWVAQQHSRIPEAMVVARAERLQARSELLDTVTAAQPNTSAGHMIWASTSSSDLSRGVWSCSTGVRLPAAEASSIPIAAASPGSRASRSAVGTSA